MTMFMHGVRRRGVENTHRNQYKYVDASMHACMRGECRACALTFRSSFRYGINTLFRVVRRLRHRARRLSFTTFCVHVVRSFFDKVSRAK